MDDIFCLSVLGLLSKKRTIWADQWTKYVEIALSITTPADIRNSVFRSRFLLIKSVNQFYKLEISRAESGTNVSDFERRHRWTYRKLACDVIFASMSDALYRIEASHRHADTWFVTPVS